MVKASDKKNEVTLLRRIRDKFKHGLVIHVIRNQLAKIGIVITPYYWVQEGVNHTEIPEIKGIASEYTVSFLEAEDIKMMGDNIRGYTVEELLADLNAGRKFLGLKHGDQIASIMYINLMECPFEPVSMPLKNDEAYLSHMHTVESFRGANLAPYLRYKSYDILKNMGRDKIYSATDFFNSSAIRYKEKLNAKNLKLVLYIRIFKRLKWSITLRTY